MLKFMLKPCCWNLFKIADLFAIWLHLSTGRRACTHGKAGSRLDCHADVLVCLFVVNVVNFWHAVIESRLSNSKLYYEFMVLCFWLLSFAWDTSTSFQSHFCCSYCLSAHSYLEFVCVGCYFDRFFIRRNGTTDFAKTGQVSDDTINLINC